MIFQNKYIFLLSCVFVCRSAAVYENGYHMDVGVPKATWLRRQPISRIVGGTKVDAATAVPYQAGIVVRLTTGWTSVCGGSVVSATRVLTAAHCWWDGQSQAALFTIVLGSLTLFSGGTRIETKQVTPHANWNTRDYTHDIAMVRIPAITFSNKIQAIPLPTASIVNNNFVGFTGTISGFGKTSDAQSAVSSSTVLHRATVPVISNAVCQRSFSLNIHGSHLCTSGDGRKGTCDGDSGGPLTVIVNNQRVQIGVVSFGPPSGCEFGEPSVYTRLTSFLNWLQAQM
ncbi:hypothetical protein O3G_MSEX010040 [Manduca sexta]|uniref:Peptidase S1 domain-containing protein n=1 Tax=Manduca sexta TaxID=7130 RepID=A0A921ZFR4_MANSE|nr:hypothetical protein O3G_MSEX010040 [Manduca sexta]KAG6456930.1 hypothetical protein O3G_MSEX010040 [Manduca sexta]